MAISAATTCTRSCPPPPPAYPGCKLFTVAALQQTPVLILGHPHREHFAAFVCQSGLLITPGRAGNLFPVGAVLDKPQARQWF